MDPQHLVIEATGAGEAPLRPPRRAAGVQAAMTLVNDLVNDLAAGSKNRLSLPEYRQIELYTKRKSLSFAEPEPAARRRCRDRGVCRAFFVLDAYLASATPADRRRDRVAALPRSAAGRRDAKDRRRNPSHPARGANRRLPSARPCRNADGIVWLNGAIDRVALSLEFTPAGLTCWSRRSPIILVRCASPIQTPMSKRC